VLDEIDGPIWLDVRVTDRGRQTLGMNLLHPAPEAAAFSQRLVDQTQVTHSTPVGEIETYAEASGSKGSWR